MRILVLIYEFPPIGGGGGMAAWEISRALSRKGHDVHVLTAHFQDLPRQEEIEGVQVVRVPSWRQSAFKAGLKPMLGYIIAGSIAGLRYIKKWRPHIIHVHFAVPTGPVGWLLSKVTGIPYVLTAHLGDVPGGVPEKTDRWFRWISPFTPPIWKSAAQVVAVSEFTRQMALRRYPVDIQVIPNAADLNELDPGEIKTHTPPEIVFAGRFMRQKNPVLIIRTLAELQDLDWRFQMIGDGPMQAQIMAEINRFGLADRIQLPGWVTPRQVIEYFRNADILFMPSLSEGLPVVGVQALAMGLAIVASRVGGFVDLIENDLNGYLVDSENQPGFAASLRSLLADPDRLQKFKLASRTKAAAFEISRIASAYEDIFSRFSK